MDYGTDTDVIGAGANLDGTFDHLAVILEGTVNLPGALEGIVFIGEILGHHIAIAGKAPCGQDDGIGIDFILGAVIAAGFNPLDGVGGLIVNQFVGFRFSMYSPPKAV